MILFLSMTYHFIGRFLCARAEVRLPLRKCAYFLLPLLSSIALPASANDLDTALKQHIQQAIDTYASAHQIDISQQQIAVNMPAGAREKACLQYRFDRAGASSAPLGRLSYKVQCLSPTQWSSRAVAHVELWAPVAVAAQTLPRNTPITQNNVNLATRALGEIHPAPVFDLTTIEGMQVRREIDSDEAVTFRYLEQPQVISRGDIVTVNVRGDGFAASTQGTALGDARKGERVKVQNKSSGKVIEGVAVDRAMVQTDF